MVADTRRHAARTDHNSALGERLPQPELRPSPLQARYPGYDEFVALRDRLDPTGVLSNAYLDRVLGVAPGR